MTPVVATTNHRLQSIDLLRGVAALAVLLLHIPHHAPGWGKTYDLAYWLWLPVDLGHLGVSLFVLLSGFCIHTNTLRASPPGELSLNWGTFWKRRFVRLYPPYAIVVLLSGLLTYVLFLRHGVTPDLALRGVCRDVLMHLGMVHNLMPIYANGLYNGPLWTLGMEEQLYALYIVLLLLRRWSLRGTVLLTLAVSALLWQAWQVWGPTTLGHGPNHLGGWTWWPFQFWFLWTLGTVAAEAHAGRISLPSWCSRAGLGGLLLAAGLLQYKLVWPAVTGQANLGATLAALGGFTGGAAVAAAWLGQALAYGSLQVAFFILVNAVIRQERQQGSSQRLLVRGLAQVGLFSYSLYLLHVPVIEACKHFWPIDSVLGRYLVLLPGCILAGWLFFHLVEKHFLYRKSPRPAVQPPVPVRDRKAA